MGPLKSLLVDINSADVDEQLKPLLCHSRKPTLEPSVRAETDDQQVFAAGWSEAAQGVPDGLCEVLMVRLLRHCMTVGLTKGGTLAGRAGARLGSVFAALHESPARDWDLSRMTSLAAMSRARFAVRFREVMGQTPADYLASWRVLRAQQLMTRGVSIKQAAEEVGYGGASALSRAFVRKSGWRQARRRRRWPDSTGVVRRQIGFIAHLQIEQAQLGR